MKLSIAICCCRTSNASPSHNNEIGEVEVTGCYLSQLMAADSGWLSKQWLHLLRMTKLHSYVVHISARKDALCRYLYNFCISGHTFLCVIAFKTCVYKDFCKSSGSMAQSTCFFQSRGRYEYAEQPGSILDSILTNKYEYFFICKMFAMSITFSWANEIKRSFGYFLLKIAILLLQINWKLIIFKYCQSIVPACVLTLTGGGGVGGGIYMLYLTLGTVN